MACYAFALFVLLSRGPHCSRFTWLGYEGRGLGVSLSIKEKEEKTVIAEEENDKSV